MLLLNGFEQFRQRLLISSHAPNKLNLLQMFKISMLPLVVYVIVSHA